LILLCSGTDNLDVHFLNKIIHTWKDKENVAIRYIQNIYVVITSQVRIKLSYQLIQVDFSTFESIYHRTHLK